MFSCVRLFVTPWICRGLFCPWGFSSQEYWSGLPCPPPGDLPNPGIKPSSPALQVDSLPAELPRKPIVSVCVMLFSPLLDFILFQIWSCYLIYLFVYLCLNIRQEIDNIYSINKQYNGDNPA